MLQQQPAQQPLALAPEAYQIAVTYQLGVPTVEYKAKFTIRKAISIVFLFVAGLAFLVMAIIASSSLRFSAVIALMLIGVLGIASTLWVLVDTFLSRDKRVYVCPAGLLYQHNGNTEAIRWDMVESFWQYVVRRYSYGIKTGSTHLYTIRRNDGVTFKFNDQLYNVEALGNIIAREITRVLWPRYFAAYQAGQSLPFGSISLNQQGVSNGKELLLWPQVKEITVKGGFLSIKKEGNNRSNWKIVQASKIPNVGVFMALVDYIVNSGRR
jgi:hypothetical protein